jgi:hypothetical protein
MGNRKRKVTESAVAEPLPRPAAQSLGGKLVRFGPPRVPSPAEALKAFAEGDLATRALLPINLLHLGEKTVAFALIGPASGMIAQSSEESHDG